MRLGVYGSGFALREGYLVGGHVFPLRGSGDAGGGDQSFAKGFPDSDVGLFGWGVGTFHAIKWNHPFPEKHDARRYRGQCLERGILKRGGTAVPGNGNSYKFRSGYGRE